MKKNNKPENNKKNFTKLKDKKYNLKKFINKNHNKSKEEIIEHNIEKILNGNNNNNNEEIVENNILKQNNYPKEENGIISEEIYDLPDLSFIRNKLHISIVKRKTINEDELN